MVRILLRDNSYAISFVDSSVSAKGSHLFSAILSYHHHFIYPASVHNRTCFQQL